MKSFVTISHKITALSAAMATVLYTTNVSAIQRTIHAPAGPSDSDNFTMLNAAGNVIGPDAGTNDVATTWDGTVFTDSSDYTGPGGGNGNMTMDSLDPFFGQTWTAHDIQMFAPGAYSFDTALGGGNPESGILGVTVGPNELGVHMLFDWNGNLNIDVFVVLSQSAVFGAGIGRNTQNTSSGNRCDGTTTTSITNCLFDGKPFGAAGKPTGNQVWMLASVDGNSDGSMGIPMATGGPFAGFNANFNFGDSIIANGLAPILTDDTSGTTPNGSVSIDVLANDIDVDGGLTNVTLTVSNEAGGTAVVNNNGNSPTVTWTNTSGNAGVDTFTYTVSDSDGNVSDAATATVNVGVGQPPVAADDAFPATEDTQLLITDAQLLANDTDPDMDPLSVDRVVNQSDFNLGAGQGTLVLQSDNVSVLYTPAPDFNGPASFNYTVADGAGSFDQATVIVNVAAVQDLPIVQDDSVQADFETTVTIPVLGNDSDPDGDTLTVTSTSTPSNGSVLINVDNTTIVYTPSTGFTGSDSFTYTVSDGNGGMATATVNVNVIGAVQFSNTPVPDTPKINPSISGGSNFTMINTNGGVTGGTNDIAVTWTGSLYTDTSNSAPNMTLRSDAPTSFFGFDWTAKNVRVFGPGVYNIDVCPGGFNAAGVSPQGDTNCGFTPGHSIQMAVGPTQIGIHMLFDWGQASSSSPCLVANCNIDVAQVVELNKAWAGPPNGDDTFKSIGQVFTMAVVDGDGDGVPGIPMLDGAFTGQNANFNLNFTQNFALPVVSLQAAQAGNTAAVIVPSGGPVTVTATGPAGATFDWDSTLLNQRTDASLVTANTNGTTSQTFVFNPAGLADGSVMARVTIRDPNKANLANSAELPIVVSSVANLAGAADANGNRIPDGDDTGLPGTKIPVQPASNTVVLESDVGVLRLGVTAMTKSGMSGNYTVGITETDIAVADSAVAGSCVGGCFDFEVTGITPGATANVVLPLDVAIPANAVYRKFANGEWRDYSLLGGDALASAPGGGVCPAPGDAAYQVGLNEGDLCVQLTITDGGRNDADGTTNGAIIDPGGVSGAAINTGGGGPISAPDPIGLDQGGCAMGNRSTSIIARADWGLLGLLLGWFGFKTRRRSHQ